MSEYDYDLFVIGAGSGGVRLSRIASSLGAKVAVAEDRYMGGTCVNVGCVPKKLFVYASHIAEDLEDGAGFGWTNNGKLNFNWHTLRDNKTNEISRLNGIYNNLLEGAGVTVHTGRARFIDHHTVSVGDQTITAKYIAIATGSWPFVPEFEGSEHAITSNEFFFLPDLPKSAMVLGGGYIAVELAGILNGLGVDTTLIYRGDLFLRGFDEDVRQFAKTEIEKKGVNLLFNNNIQSVSKASDAYKVTLEDGSIVNTGLVLAATGRKAHIQDIGIENTDITLNDAGNIVVDSHFTTSVDNIFAVGDVKGGYQLTPVALAEGMALARHLFAGKPINMDYDNIPTAVFCQPTIGTVGLTEQQARERFGDIDVYKSDFRPMKHTMSGRDERTFMKLLVDVKTDRVVGAHMVGPEAGEIMQGVAVAMKAGATKAHFDETIGIHPTAAEEFVTMREPV
ncbi:glutathione-disulfide reductase [Alkalimarinus alittae]|uniref:Glutathione-disulfide reductase n=1 Tax=Alkalimarinus alittae TaxID=2961619 RepID=A0ABY6MXC6_9ALTE|nr:glutathione-disulfide reductase [Alkalimarinus alittae]UZE94482.1 glutathione-disulfide reductase [Alkalimarinus alittae]